MEKLGSFIIQQRSLKDLKQVELAQLADISKSYLSQIENGKRIPELSVLKKIAIALEIPLEALIIKSLTKKTSFDVIVSLLESLQKDQKVDIERKDIYAEIQKVIEQLIKDLSNDAHLVPVNAKE